MQSDTYFYLVQEPNWGEPVGLYKSREDALLAIERHYDRGYFIKEIKLCQDYLEKGN